MSSNIEIEAKVLLTEEQYNQIIDSLQLARYRKYRQSNYYIDNNELSLKKHNLFLRIREKDEDFVLTLKAPLSEGLLEKNDSITWKQYENLKDRKVFPDGSIKTFLNILGYKTEKLYIISSLETERIDIEYDGGLVSLDKNMYNGNTDYEIECEQTSMIKAENTIAKILANIGVKQFTFNNKSKESRAMNSLSK